MNREYAEILIQRTIDSAITDAEREELVRALRDDPVLRAEVDEMTGVHAALGSMFAQLALPRDFGHRVMRRIQPAHVPTDAALSGDSTRIPRSGRPQFIRHRSSRLVYWIASFSTAAAVALTISLVIQLGGPPEVVTDFSQDKGRQGVPGFSGGNRTDPLSPNPGKREASEPAQGTEASQPGRASVPSETDAPGAIEPPAFPEEVTKPESRPAGREAATPSPVVPRKGEPGPRKEGARVEDEPAPQPAERQGTEAGPAKAKSAIGRLSILKGRAEIATGDGKWQLLKGDEELREGAQLRTSVAGHACLSMPNGTLTLASNTTVRLAGAGMFNLESGAVAVDKPLQADAEYLGVRCDAYVFYVKNGAASLERKRQKLAVQHLVGLSTLTHDSFGSVVFEKSSTLDLEIGKEYPSAKAVAGMSAPEWVATSRLASLMAELEPRLAERFSGREKRMLDQRLPSELKALVSIALDRGAAVEFMLRALENKKFDAACVMEMARELNAQIAANENSVPDNLAVHGARASLQPSSGDFATWRENFLKLVKGDSGKRIVTETWRKVTRESPEPGKIKPVEPPSVPLPEPAEDK